jgi:hypothetical protein
VTLNQQMMGLPIVTVGDFTFNIAAIAGIDWGNYEAGSDKREVYLILLGGGEHLFTNEAADAFKLWFDLVPGSPRPELQH